jgi:hypothetical protein
MNGSTEEIQRKEADYLAEFGWALLGAAFNIFKRTMESCEM